MMLILGIGLSLVVAGFLLFVLSNQEVWSRVGCGVFACAIAFFVGAIMADSRIDTPNKAWIYISMPVVSSKSLCEKYPDARIVEVFSFKRKDKIIHMVKFTTSDGEVRFARLSKDFHDYLKSRDPARLVPDNFTPQEGKEAPATP